MAFSASRAGGYGAVDSRGVGGGEEGGSNGMGLGKCCGLHFAEEVGVALGVGLLRSLVIAHGLVGEEDCG